MKADVFRTARLPDPRHLSPGHTHPHVCSLAGLVTVPQQASLFLPPSGPDPPVWSDLPQTTLLIDSL